MTTEEVESLVKRIESGELSEDEELSLLRELDFSYDVMDKYLEEIKVVKLSEELKK